MTPKLRNQFMTAKEVSDFFRVPLSLVYRLVQNDVLKSIRLGRHVRIFRSEVERLCGHCAEGLIDELKELEPLSHDPTQLSSSSLLAKEEAHE